MESTQQIPNNTIYNDVEVSGLLQKKYDYHSEFLESFFSIIDCLEHSDQTMLLRSLTLQAKTFKIPLVIIIEDNQIYITKIVQLFATCQTEIIELAKVLLDTFWFEKDPNTSIPNIKTAALAFGVSGVSDAQVMRPSLNPFEEVYIKIRDQKSSTISFRKYLTEKNFKLDQQDIQTIRGMLKNIRNLINRELKAVDEVFYEYVYGYFNTEARKLTETEDFLLNLPEIKKIEKKEEEKTHSEKKEIVKNAPFYPTVPDQKSQSSNQIPVNQINQTIPQISKANIVTNDMDPRFKTSFYLNELLQSEESLNVEYKNYFWPFNTDLIHQIKRQICGFLNLIGGRIYIGISDDRVVHGIKLDSKERDILRNEIINYTKEFYPACRLSHIMVDFVPIKKKNNEFVKNLWVVKIIVRQGDTGKLYSTSKFGFQSFKRMHGQCVILSADEIEQEIITRSQKTSIPVDSKEFEDKPAEKPIQYENEKKPNKYRSSSVGQENNTHSNENNKKDKIKNIFGGIVRQNNKIPKFHNPNPSLANNASMNNKVINNQPGDQQPGSMKQCKTTYTGVSVRGIPPDTTDEEFKRLFEPFNLLPSKPINVIRNKDTGKCSGQAYVNFTTFEQASTAAEILLGLELAPNYKLSLKIQQN